MNKINLQRNFGKTQIKFEEFKVFCVKNMGDYYTCYHSEYISNYKTFIKLINLEILKRAEDNISETTLSFLDNVVVYWSTNIHMKLILLIRDIRDFLESLGQEIVIQDAERSEKKYIQHLRVMAQCEWHIEISPEHKAKISLGKSFIKYLILLIKSIKKNINQNTIYYFLKYVLACMTHFV